MKEFDFNNVGKRMPYRVPEGFFEQAKQRAKSIGEAGGSMRSNMGRMVARVAVAAAVGLAVCGTALWLEDFASPESRYERMLAEVSTDVLWEYSYDYDAEIGIVEGDEFY